MQSEELRIIKKCLRNNSLAQKELYEKYKLKWFMICLRYGKDRRDAEDILQEGLISVFKSLRQYDQKKALFAVWSAKVMVNAALQYMRKWKRLDFNLNIDDREEEIICDDSVYDELGAKELTSLIQRLPDGYRIVFNMYVVEGYKHKEIAELLNISESTSKSQLFKAKKILKYQLEKVLNY